MESIENVFHLNFHDDATIEGKFEVKQSCKT